MIQIVESIIQGEGVFFKLHFFNCLLPQIVIFGQVNQFLNF